MGPVQHLLQFFTYKHLTAEKLQSTSKLFCDLAKQLAQELPDNPEKTVALRKLLEAKDAAVRAVISSLIIFALLLPAPATAQDWEWLAAACISHGALYPTPLPAPGPAPGPSPTPTPGPKKCDNCGGTGKVGDGTISVTCPVCDGKGVTTGPPSAAELTATTIENARLKEQVAAWRQWKQDIDAWIKRREEAMKKAAAPPTTTTSQAQPIRAAPAPVRRAGSHWTHPSDIVTHLLTHPNHARKTAAAGYTRADLERMNPSQLEALHDNQHNGYAAPAPMQRLLTYGVSTGSGCPGGRCPR